MSLGESQIQSESLSENLGESQIQSDIQSESLGERFRV